MSRETKAINILASVLMLASLTSATAQRPVPTPRPPDHFAGEVIAGPTPFIRFVRVRFNDISRFKFAEFLIQPKAGSATRPVDVHYSRSYLESRGYVGASDQVTIPVFGLYAGRSNHVMITLGSIDRFHPIETFGMTITTPAYDGGTYSNPTVIQPRLHGRALSYDFILLKNFNDPDTPIIIDSDAEVRWVGTAGVATTSCMLFDNAFYLGSGTQLLRTEFDGRTYIMADYAGIGITDFHHNIDPGRSGMIVDVDTSDQTESVNMEVDASGSVLRTWKLAHIISAAMLAGGDDPRQFVYPPPNDWFHNNACAYRSSDNSLIVSSRENFVIALDYDSGDIKWILGDPTKHWYQFRSLRAFALALAPGTLPPIGQHAVSVPDDQLLLFDDGTGSDFQQPPGETRNYSAPRKYQIDFSAFQATETWHYEPDPSIYSPFCSSVYQDAPGNYLVDYAQAGPYTYTDIRGIDASGDVAFDYQYQLLGFCATAWNAIQIHWENLTLD